MKGKMKKRIALMLYKKPGANRRILQMRKSFDEVSVILNGSENGKGRKKQTGK